MKVLLDLNIILDVLLNRAPWVTDSAATWDAHRAGEVVAHVAAFAVPTVFYVMRRQSDLRRAHEGVRICLETLEIAPVGRSTLQLARRQAGSDYEDNLQIACAVEAGLDAIVSRDPTGFAQSPIPVLSPTDLLQQLAAAKSNSPARE
jgi:predicted nucleic acid-binding protein